MDVSDFFDMIPGVAMKSTPEMVQEMLEIMHF